MAPALALPCVMAHAHSSRRVLRLAVVCAVFVPACGEEGRPGSSASIGDWTGDASDDIGSDDSDASDGSSSSDSGSSDSSSSDSSSSESSSSSTGETGECLALAGFSASEPFASGDRHSHPLPSFAVGNHYYVHTMIAGDSRELWSAPAGQGGALGPWQLASPDHGGGPHGFAAIRVGAEAYHFRNGHIARYPLTAEGLMNGDVILVENDPNAAFAGERYVWDTVVHAVFGDGAQQLLHLGGFSFTPYDYRRELMRNTVPPGPVFTQTGLQHPATRPGKSTFYSADGAGHGWVYSGEGEGQRLWRLQVAGDGTPLGGYVELASTPAGDDNGRGDLITLDRTLFVVRGSQVFRTFIDPATGDLGDWTLHASLPEP
ncbi:MAG: hypothetical protein KC431_03740, partial [Myxococcales bacterium]|nr:hypothetical protein [Myxococcales bacterium]